MDTAGKEGMKKEKGEGGGKKKGINRHATAGSFFSGPNQLVGLGEGEKGGKPPSPLISFCRHISASFPFESIRGKRKRKKEGRKKKKEEKGGVLSCLPFPTYSSERRRKERGRGEEKEEKATALSPQTVPYFLEHFVYLGVEKGGKGEEEEGGTRTLILYPSKAKRGERGK